VSGGSRSQRGSSSKYWPVYATVWGVWLSGVVWLILHYFFQRQAQFGAVPNPFEHWSLVSHGALAFACLWLLGFLWGTHIVRRWNLHRHRKTGGSLFAVMSLLCVTGYLLYYVGSDDLRPYLSIAHWVIGLVLPATLIAHWAVRKR
jgi:hypothetical protein